MTPATSVRRKKACLNHLNEACCCTRSVFHQHQNERQTGNQTRTICPKTAPHNYYSPILQTSVAMEPTSGRRWVGHDPWTLLITPDVDLLDSNLNDTGFYEFGVASSNMSILTSDLTLNHSATNSPFSPTFSDMDFLDDLEYTSEIPSSIESSPRLPGDGYDPLAADFAQHPPTSVGQWLPHTVLRMPTMFDDIPLQLPSNDELSTWPLFPTTTVPGRSIYPSGADIIESVPIESSFPSTYPVFPCLNCDKVFDTKQKLRQHRRHVHLKPASCDVCGKRFGSTRDLTRHIETHHLDVSASLPAESQRSRCPEPGCGYKGRKDNVIRHCRMKHGKDARKKGQGSPSFGP